MINREVENTLVNNGGQGKIFLYQGFDQLLPKNLSLARPLPEPNLGGAMRWLSVVIAGERDEQVFKALSRIYKDVTPYDDGPVTGLVGSIRNRDYPDRRLAYRLGEVSGELLRPALQVRGQLIVSDQDMMEDRTWLLYLLQVAPPKKDIPDLLYFSYRSTFRNNSANPFFTSRSGHDFRREALSVIAARQPEEVKPKELNNFFVSEMVNPDYIVATYSGLIKSSLTEAIAQVPNLLARMEQANLDPSQALWTLFWNIEHNNKDLSNLLGSVTANDQTRKMLEEVCGRIKAHAQFPRVTRAIFS